MLTSKAKIMEIIKPASVFVPIMGLDPQRFSDGAVHRQSFDLGHSAPFHLSQSLLRKITDLFAPMP